VSDVVFRVTWRPGTDTLLGTCHCGAEHLADDPIELWAWLLAHPAGHEPIATSSRVPAGSGAAR
jgi:hypothetical protein